MKTRDKPKVLCLGVSYADIQGQLAQEGYHPDVWSTLKKTESGTKDSVLRVAECVKRNVLTAMDGRDLARCIAMEKKHKVDAFTVSQELGAVYCKTKHLHANFNRGSFCRTLQEAFGKDVKFRQIILDYFWIPKGTWSMTHWTRSFFETTLPNLAQFLETPRERNTNLSVGVVFLPFCLHCVKHVVANLSILSQHYTISFVSKETIAVGHALFSGTQTIPSKIMQETFGKQIDQEEVYCRFGPADVFGEMDDSTITKEEIVKVLRRIEDFESVRMIQLKKLQPGNSGPKGVLSVFENLMDPSKSASGFDRMMGYGRKVTDESNNDSTENDSEGEACAALTQRAAKQKRTQKRSLVKNRCSTKRRKSNMSITKRVGKMAGVDTIKYRPRLLRIVEDIESYELLGNDSKLMKFYEIVEKSPCVQIRPDFRHCHWEILSNNYCDKLHCCSTLDCLAANYYSPVAEDAGIALEVQPQKHENIPTTKCTASQPRLNLTKSSDQLVVADAAIRLLLLRRGLILYPHIDTQRTNSEYFTVVQRLVREELRQGTENGLMETSPRYAYKMLQP